jgi:hypothetical protein
MPVIVDTVANRDFASLERRGGSFAGSPVNALAAVPCSCRCGCWPFSCSAAAVYLAVTLLLNAWVNQRQFRQCALALHADPTNCRRDPRCSRTLFGLGLVPRRCRVPFVNLLAPPARAPPLPPVPRRLSAFRARNAT